MKNAEKSRCLRCDGEMAFIGTEKIQLGQTGLLTGMWNNILAGSLEVGIYICSECGKVEFYTTHSSEYYREDTPQQNCPGCGKTHDFDYPKCPFCKYRY